MFEKISKFLFSVATIVLSLFFGWQAYQLNKIEIGPTISIHDVCVQTIDNTGTPRRNNCMFQGELIDNVAVPQVALFGMSISLKNSGRNPALIKFRNLDSPEEYGNKSNVLSFHEQFFIPAGGIASGLFGIQLGNGSFCQEDFATYTYDYDIEYKKIKYNGKEDKNFKNVLFTIKCSFIKDDQGCKEGVPPPIDPHCIISNFEEKNDKETGHIQRIIKYMNKITMLKITRLQIAILFFTLF